MRLLHARPDHVRARPHRRRPRRRRGEHQGRDERQSLPLRRLSAYRCGDRRGGAAVSAHPFAYRRAATESEAFDAAALAGASYIAGGTDLMQLWKLGAAAPRMVIDINALPFGRIEAL